MLTIEQLRVVSHLLSEFRRIDSSILLAEADDFVYNEIDRRKRGPLTLVEARASGRPFRRNDWAAWASDVTGSPDGPEAITSDGWHIIWLRIDDITACDYELEPKGGE